MAAHWQVVEGNGGESAGRSLAVLRDGSVRARFFFGPPHTKAFLHLYAADGTPLTHPGINGDGAAFGDYPRLRGFSIGWDRVTSPFGTDDFWHAGASAPMRLENWSAHETNAAEVTLSARLAWLRAETASGSVAEPRDALLEEVRTFRFSERANGALEIDARHDLTARQPLFLDGDAHHGGIQFRAAQGMKIHPRGFDYAWEPGAPPGDGVVAGKQRAWMRLRFGVGERSYACLFLNHPANPLEACAWRDYGRFGYFFRRQLARDERLRLRYRLVLAEEGAALDELLDLSSCKGMSAGFAAESVAG